MNTKSMKVSRLSLSDPLGALKVVPRTVQSETVGKLRNAILMGQFKPGTRLAEAMLCELMDVSRTSIREALRRLEGEKLITIIPNRGPSVARIEWTDAKSIYEVRALLEGEAAARFASRTTPADIQAMQCALRAFNGAIAKDDATERVTATNDFYQVILRGCANSVIGEVLQSLNARINFLRFQSMARPGRSKHSAVELRRIFNALEKGDAAAARQAAVAHVESACEAVKVFYQSE
jgi:DNA-binding GntR family transcriptional regulator